MIECVRYLDYQRPPLTTFKGRSYKNDNLEEARKFYSRYDNSSIFEMSDVDLIWEALLKRITKCANTLSPFKTITVPNNRPAWVTEEILKAIQNRDEAFEEAYTHGDLDLLVEAKRQCTATKEAVRNARSSYIQTQLQNNSGNPRKLWVEINYLIKTPVKSTTYDLLNDDRSNIPSHEIPTHINESLTSH